MNVQETPLVIFTVLAQMSVGCFVVLGVIHLVGGRRAGPAAVDRLSDPALYAIGPVMFAGLVASVFHLGNPANMLHAVAHLDSSWLSREVFLGCLFAGLGAAFAVTQWFKWLTPLLRQVLAGVTALVGLGLVYAMSMVYLLPTVPGWNTWATPVSFFTTTFLLGTLAVGAAFVAAVAVQKRRGQAAEDDVLDLLRSTLRGISVSAIALLGVEFVVLPTYMLDMATRAGDVTTQSLAAAGGAMFVVRLVLVFIGAGLLSVFLYRFANARRDRLMTIAVSAAFAFVLVSEVLGRILFYSSYARIGM